MYHHFTAKCAKEQVEPYSQDCGVWAQIGLNCCADVSQDVIFVIY